MPDRHRDTPGDEPPGGEARGVPFDAAGRREPRRRAAGAAVRRWWRRHVAPAALRLATGVARGHAAMYVGIASLVGADAAAVAVGAAAIWPVGIPVLLAALALAYLWRDRLGSIRRRFRSRR